MIHHQRKKTNKGRGQRKPHNRMKKNRANGGNAGMSRGGNGSGKQKRPIRTDALPKKRRRTRRFEEQCAANNHTRTGRSRTRYRNSSGGGPNPPSPTSSHVRNINEASLSNQTREMKME